MEQCVETSLVKKLVVLTAQDNIPRLREVIAQHKEPEELLAGGEIILNINFSTEDGSLHSISMLDLSLFNCEEKDKPLTREEAEELVWSFSDRMTDLK